MSFAQAASTVAIPADTAFADYYAEFSDVITAAQTSVAAAESSVAAHPDRATDRLHDADRQLDEASDLVSSLELELQSLSQTLRTSLRPHVAAARDKLSRQRTAVRAVRSELAVVADDDARVRLLSDTGDRIRMSDATADLEAASNSITDSRRHASETEAVGASILADLQQQRATIMRSRNTLGTVDSGIHQSSNILSTMQRRALLNRIVVYVVAAIILLAILLVLYLRLFNHGESVPPPAATQPERLLERLLS